MSDKIVKKGEIYWVDFACVDGNLNGVRPCLILEENTDNNIKLCLITSRIMKHPSVAHITIPADEKNKLRVDGTILTESVITIPISAVKEVSGTVSNEIMHRVNKRLNLFDETYVEALVYAINDQRKIFEKYKDKFCKTMADGQLEELKKYCAEYNKDYKDYLKL